MCPSLGNTSLPWLQVWGIFQWTVASCGRSQSDRGTLPWWARRGHRWDAGGWWGEGTWAPLAQRAEDGREGTRSNDTPPSTHGDLWEELHRGKRSRWVGHLHLPIGTFLPVWAWHFLPQPEEELDLCLPEKAPRGMKNLILSLFENMMIMKGKS